MAVDNAQIVRWTFEAICDEDIDRLLGYYDEQIEFLPLTGTLGAVIKIREPFPNRTALFDIGVGGPIAGFIVLIPALFIGMSMSTPNSLREISVLPEKPARVPP